MQLYRNTLFFLFCFLLLVCLPLLGCLRLKALEIKEVGNGSVVYGFLYY